MSKHVEYHTIEIMIPKEMLNLSKSGKVSLVPSLTKTGNPSKRAGKSSLILKVSDDNKPHILEEGKIITKEELQDVNKKAKKKEKVNKLHEDYSNVFNKLKLIDFDEINNTKPIKTSLNKKRKDFFDEWLHFFKPLQNANEWHELNEQQKYYYFKMYKSNIVNLQLDWFKLAFGKQRQVPIIKLTEEAQEYVDSNPKKPPNWRNEDSMNKYNKETVWGKIHGQITNMLVAEHESPKLEYMFTYD